MEASELCYTGARALARLIRARSLRSALLAAQRARLPEGSREALWDAYEKLYTAVSG